MKVHIRFSALSNSHSFEFEAETEEESALLKHTKEGMYGKEFLAKMYGYSERDAVIKKVSLSFVVRSEEKERLAQKPHNELPC